MTTLLPPPPTEHLSSQSSHPPPVALTAPTSSLLACVVERLYQEYDCCLSLNTVIEVVASCLEDIQATPAAALPELTERLARHRLAQIGHPGGS